MQTIAQALAPTLAAPTSPETTPKPVTDWRPRFDCYESSVTTAAQLATKFVADVARGSAPYWLTLTGVPGCGKTMLAKQVFVEASRYNPGNVSLWVAGTGILKESNRRPKCVWLTATEFADMLRDKIYDLPEYLGADFLVAIDDLGAARDTTAFISDALYRLCNARMGKWTLFTSNLSAKAVADQIDPRVASRLIRDGNIAHRITAPDYALRNR